MLTRMRVNEQALAEPITDFHSINLCGFNDPERLAAVFKRETD